MKLRHFPEKWTVSSLHTVTCAIPKAKCEWESVLLLHIPQRLGLNLYKVRAFQISLHHTESKVSQNIKSDGMEKVKNQCLR